MTDLTDPGSERFVRVFGRVSNHVVTDKLKLGIAAWIELWLTLDTWEKRLEQSRLDASAVVKMRKELKGKERARFEFNLWYAIDCKNRAYAAARLVPTPDGPLPKNKVKIPWLEWILVDRSWSARKWFQLLERYEKGRVRRVLFKLPKHRQISILRPEDVPISSTLDPTRLLIPSWNPIDVPASELQLEMFPSRRNALTSVASAAASSRSTAASARRRRSRQLTAVSG